ncbi:MAG TPA: prepilin peptidase [Candidatus Absconditabacterales bacterium]|nr:prepilin peptidase [Candidatus Absconditabacterales bacterium]HNG97097.1 prepilin peptidase [Candidatus Absconditabacterales bacterium]
MYIILLIIAFIFGSCIGSWILWIVHHGHIGRLSDRSICDGCGRQLRWYEMIPIISYIVLGAQCRTCHYKLDVSYLGVEFFSGVLGVVGMWWFMTMGIYELGVGMVVIFILIGMIILGVTDSVRREIHLGWRGMMVAGIMLLDYNLFDVYEWFIPLINMTGVWFMAWVIGLCTAKILYGERRQGLGFGDVLVSMIIGLLSPFVLLSYGDSAGDYSLLGMSSVSSLGWFLWSVLYLAITSIAGILCVMLITIVSKKKIDQTSYELPLVPIMILSFVIIAIVTYYFSDYIIFFLGV